MAFSGKDGAFWSQTTGSSLLSNASFATGVSNWTKGEAKTTGCWDGTGSAFVTGATTMSQTGTAVYNQYYVLSAMCKVAGSADPTGTSYVKLSFLTSGGSVLSSGTDTIGTGASSWKRYSVIRRATPTGTRQLKASFIAGTGSDIYVDDVRCYRLEQVGGFSNWSLDVSYDTHDVTCFESAGDWREFIDGLKQWSASASQYWASSDMFQALTGTEEIYGVFYIDSDSDMTGKRWEGMVDVHGISISTPVDAVVTADITMQGTGDIAYIED